MSPSPRSRAWSTGDRIAALSSALVALSLAVSLIWGYARIASASEAIPRLQSQQQTNMLDIRQLKTQQTNSDARYSEILSQLDRLNDKLDHLKETRP